MYEIWFTDGWWYDVCSDGHQGEYLVLGILLFIIVIICIALLFHLRRIFRDITKTITVKVAYAVLSIILSILAFIAGAWILLVGNILQCIEPDPFFWNQVWPAHEMRLDLVEACKTPITCPKNEEELRAINPEKYDEVVSRNKTYYWYDATDNRYVWIIRATKGRVMIFDTLNEYDYYYLNKPNSPYPPSYDGPWDKLPT